MAFTNLEETDMVLIYGEARDIQSQHGKSTVKGFLEEYFPNPNARTFVNVVQHLRDFGRFEMKKRDLRVFHFVIWLRVQNAPQEICQNRGILNQVRPF
jgi:hypothetical protein